MFEGNGEDHDFRRSGRFIVPHTFDLRARHLRAHVLCGFDGAFRLAGTDDDLAAGLTETESEAEPLISGTTQNCNFFTHSGGS